MPFINQIYLGKNFDVAHFLKDVRRYYRVGFWYIEGKSNQIHLGRNFISHMGLKTEVDYLELETFLKYVHPSDTLKIKKALKRLKKRVAVHQEIEVRLRVNDDWRWTRIAAASFQNNSEVPEMLIIGQFKNIDTNKFSKANDFNKKPYHQQFASFRFNPNNGIFSWYTPTDIFFSKQGGDNTFWHLDDYKDVLGPYQYTEFTALWNNFVKNDKQVDFIFDFLHKNLSYRFCALKVPGSLILQGGVFRIGGANELQVKSLFDRFLKLLNKHNFAIIEIDNNGTIINANGFAEKFFQFRVAEVQKIRSYFTDQTFAQFSEWLNDTLKKTLEISVVLPDLTMRKIVWTKFDDDAENPSSRIIAARGVTPVFEIKEQNKNLFRRIQATKSFFSRLSRNTLPEEIYLIIGEKLEELYPKSISVVFSYNGTDGFITIESVFGVKAKEWEAFINELGWNPVGRRLFIDETKLDVMLTGQVVLIDKPFNEILDGIFSAAANHLIEKTFKISKAYLTGIVKDGNLFGGIIVLQTADYESLSTDFLTDIAELAAVVIDFASGIEELAVKIDSLKSLLDGKNDLIAYINHKVRTPLNSILGFSSLFDLPEIDEVQRKEFIKLINSQGQQLVDIMNGVQDFLRIENHSFTIIQSKVRINEFFRDFVDALKQNKLLDEPSISFSLIIPDNTDFLELYTDSGRLSQALQLYTVLIARFVQTGTVDIGYSIHNDKVQLFIKEGESTVNSSIRAVLLDELKNLLQERVPYTAHLSIQLANKIIGLLGGQASFEGKEKLQVNIQMNLLSEPVVQSDTEVQSIPTTYGADFKNRVILIAEDEEVNYIFLNELIASWGASTLWARNGREAVELVNTLNQGIDMILMDIRMPVMDGYAATMEVKQINSSIPIVAQTAFSSPQERLKAQAAGCNAYITKPIEMDVLFHVLEVFLK